MSKIWKQVLPNNNHGTVNQVKRVRPKRQTCVQELRTCVWATVRNTKPLPLSLGPNWRGSGTNTCFVYFGRETESPPRKGRAQTKGTRASLFSQKANTVAPIYIEPDEKGSWFGPWSFERDPQAQVPLLFRGEGKHSVSLRKAISEMDFTRIVVFGPWFSHAARNSNPSVAGTPLGAREFLSLQGLCWATLHTHSWLLLTPLQKV